MLFSHFLPSVRWKADTHLGSESPSQMPNPHSAWEGLSNRSKTASLSPPPPRASFGSGSLNTYLLLVYTNLPSAMIG